MVERTLSVEAGAAIDALGDDARLSGEDVELFSRVISTSLRAVLIVNGAVEDGSVRRFRVARDDEHGGIGYVAQERAIVVPARRFCPRAWWQAADTVFAVARQAQYARNSILEVQVWDVLRDRVRAIARAGGNDYGEVLSEFMHWGRLNEDYAELEGWNAFVEYAAGTGVPLARAVAETGRAQVVAKSPDGQRLVFREGFEPKPSGILEPSPENMAAMSRHFSGAPADVARVGRTGESDYPHYYAALALSEIGTIHAREWSGT